MGGFSKVIQLGQFGQLTLSEQSGQGTVALSVAGSLGGGSVAGVAKAKASVEVDASVLQLADAGLVALEAKYPQFSVAIAGLKTLMDAEAVNL